MLWQDTGWVPLAPGSGWSQFDLAWRLWNGEVLLQGEIWGGENGSTCFTLPPGARPGVRLSRVIARPASATGYTTIGNLAIQTTGVATVVSLGGSIPTSSPGIDVSSVRFIPAAG